MKEVLVGTKGTAVTMVDATKLAVTVKSGSLPVFATPMMVALMEQAACDALSKLLDEGETTVGTAVSILHMAATPSGLQVTAEAEVTAVSGREITFRVTAHDRSGIIGEGTHKRCVVNAERFLEKTNAKRGK